MIPVKAVDAPADFDIRVRQRGLAAIAELVGEPTKSRRGPKRKNTWPTRDAIPAEAFPPYWRDVLPDMLAAYNHLCAYLALYIHPATGNATVDHVIPKSKAWDRVYEWSNYRLASGLINSKKSDFDLALDPFAIEGDWFELELVEFQVIPGMTLSDAKRLEVAATIETLGLNRRDCCVERRRYAEWYLSGEVDLQHLERCAPFVARELRRQGGLARGEK